MSTPTRDTSRNAHILIVEDESGILTSLQLILEMEGYRVSTATNGSEALALLTQVVPDLVVTDFIMPYADGGELIRAIRADPELRHLPIVLMSAAMPENDSSRKLVDAYLGKPFAIDALLDVIHDLLG